MTREEFRTMGYALIDWIADYRDRLPDLSVMSQVQPGEVRRQLPAEPPQQGGGLSAVLPTLEQTLLPGLTHWQHPAFYGYFPGVAPTSSVLADLLSTGLGVNGLSWIASPAVTEMEETMTDWLRQMLGLPATFSGVIQDTASTACLVALICARERSTSLAQYGQGIGGYPRPLMVYTSEQAHSSVLKAALLAGFGQENVRLIPSNAQHALDLEQLALAMDQDLAAGRQPCALVATVGSTGTTALDPVAGMAALAAQHEVWLHVDAALAGAAMILPECRWMWQGIEQADSITLNPHKWLGAAFDCSLYYVRDPQHLTRVMSTNPSYLKASQDTQVRTYRDWGIPLGRRFRSLKLWFLLLDEGVQGLQARLRRDLGYAQWLAQQVEATPGWTLLAPVPLQTVCLRYQPEALAGDELDRFTLDWANRINQSGKAYLTPAILQGRWMVRVAFGAEATQLADVEALWSLLRQQAEG
jgi:aromatic-L-amino-acid decarboxylase